MKKFLGFAVSLAVVVGMTGVAQAKGHPFASFSAADAKYFPLDIKNPDGANMAVVDGDPQKGESVFLLKMKKGVAPIHSHTNDYSATVISGTTKHWEVKDTSAVKEFGPGSFWFQPGKTDHNDECVSDECVIMIHVMGKFDFVPGKGAATPAKK